MSRLAAVDCTRLSAEQQTLFDAIVDSPRSGAARERQWLDSEGHIAGPFNAWLQVPALGAHWSAIGAALRFHSSLESRLFELTVLVVAAHARADYEWAAHAPLALKAGLAIPIVEAIGRSETPPFIREDEAAVHAFAAALVQDCRVDSSVYDRAFALLGQTAIVELVSVVGYYLALAVALNAFQVEPPPGNSAGWQPAASTSA